MHVYGAGLNVGSRLPDDLEQQIARLDSAFTLGEQQEKLELSWSQIDFAPVDSDTMRRAVDPEGP